MAERALIDFTKLKKKRFENQVPSSTALINNNNENTNKRENVTNTNNNNENDNKNDNNNMITNEYEQYLGRILEIIQNSGIIKEERISLSRPVLQRAGTRTVWTNFESICNSLNRPIEHVYSFFVKELGTETSLGGDNQFFMKGRYQSTRIETLITKYSKEFVRCPNCKSMNTSMNKENKIQTLDCNNCKNIKTIQKI